MFCKGMLAASVIIAEAERAVATASGSPTACADGACTVCLNDDPPPIQSGCACRGDAGLAHVECLAEAAEHRSRLVNGRTPPTYRGWWECGTCKTDFTGAMQVGLAMTWWSKAQRLAFKQARFCAENDQWWCAGHNLALALKSHSMDSKAETISRCTVKPLR
jgi:hypothetical protein